MTMSKNNNNNKNNNLQNIIKNKKIFTYIRFFIFGLFQIIDNLFPVLLLIVSITALTIIPKYSGYYACVLFVLSLLGILIFLHNTYARGKEYVLNKQKDVKERKTSKNSKTNKTETKEKITNGNK